jgi:uncharacterized protein
MSFSTRNILLLGLITLLGMGGLGLVLQYFFSDYNLMEFYRGYEPIWVQLVVGSIYGLIGAYLGWKIINMPYLAPVRSKYGSMIYQLNLKLPHIIFISICAGVGEEVLFRGIIQEWLGIWLTAIIFVAIHGYLNPRDKLISIYGAFMTLVIVGMGYLAENTGIIAAMAAHTVVDIYLLHKLTNIKPANFQSSDEEDEDYHFTENTNP